MGNFPTFFCLSLICYNNNNNNNSNNNNKHINCKERENDMQTLKMIIKHEANHEKIINNLKKNRDYHSIILSKIHIANQLAFCLEYNMNWNECRRICDNLELALIQDNDYNISHLFTSVQFSDEELIVLTVFTQIYDILRQMMWAEEDVLYNIHKQLNMIQQLYGEDIYNIVKELSIKQARQLGFRKYNKLVNNKHLMLLPFYACYMLPENLCVTNTFGNQCELRQRNRNIPGICLSYGLLFKD